MLGWKGDQEVRDQTLAVPGMLKVPVYGSCCGRDKRTEEAIRLGIYNDTTVINHCLRGDFNGGVAGSPRIEGELGTHQDFPESVEWFA